MSLKAVVFDFFGTLVESDGAQAWVEELLQQHGYAIDQDIWDRWSFDKWDGREHHDASQSEHHYAQWEQSVWHGMFDEGSVPQTTATQILEALRAILDTNPFRPYPETLQTLEELRDRGLALALCSNWNWQLNHHAEGAGLAHLFDAAVSSAWAGARKPHPLPFESILSKIDVQPHEALFVGDSWRCDIEGALDVGMSAVHVCRVDHDPHGSFDDCPLLPDGARRINDLTGVLDFA